MCTNPIKIYNKSKYHDPTNTRVFLQVPCGKCAECIAQKRAEWSLRSSIEYDFCKKNGGYVYFDTLTYNNENIPRFRDHACFQRKHIQDFLKRIRKRIASDYNIRKRAFRYFYVSEYGHQYKRPHYHILFYVSNHELPYYVLKKYIKEEWIYGFTDLNSVKQPFRGIVESEMCCQYVAKYVTKPDSYIFDLQDNYKDIVSKEEFRKYFYPFHQQSTGFGESILFDMTQLEHFKQMFCVFRHTKYTLPLYYIRKLYYNLVTMPDGSSSWQLSENGLQFVPQYKYKLYEDYKNRLCAFVDAAPQFLAVPSICRKVTSFIAKNDLYFPEHSQVSGCDIRYCTLFLRLFDSDFLAKFAFWKRFEEGYIDLTQLENYKDFAYDNELVYLSFYGDGSENRAVLSARIDAAFVPKYKVFDSLLKVFKSSIGELKMLNLEKQLKFKRMFNYLEYANC